MPARNPTRVGEAERRVVAEAEPAERDEIPVRVDAEVVVAMAGDLAREAFEQRLLGGELAHVLRREVAAVQADLGSRREQLLDELRAQPVVRLRRGAVRPVSVARHDVERRPARAVGALLGRDLREAPVRIRAAHLVERHPRERAGLVERTVPQARRRAAYPDSRPAPRSVDVVRQRDREPRCRRSAGGSIPSSRRSRSSGGSSGSRQDAAAGNRFRSSRSPPISSTRARWKNAVGNRIALGQLAALDALPRVGVVRHVGAEPQGHAHRACRAPSAPAARPAPGQSSPGLYVPLERRCRVASQLRGLGRDSVIYGIGGLTSRFLSVLMLPLYTSYVSAGDYGRIELLMATMAIAVVLIRGGANFGFIRFYFLDKEPEYRRRLVRTVFWAQLGYSTLALLLCVVLARQIGDLLGIANHGPHLQGSGTSLVIATAVLLWANVNYAQMTNLFRAEKRAVPFSLATLANIAITVGLTVILVVAYHEGPLGIIVGNLSGTLIMWCALLAYRREQLGLQFDGKLLRTMNRFGFPLMAAALAGWVTNFGDRLMLSKLLNGSDRLIQLGQYSLANKISSAMVLLFTAFQIAWPAFAYSIEDEDEAKRAYSFILTYLILIAAWAALALSLFAPWLSHWLGRKPGYWPASTAIPALAFSSVFFAGFIVVTVGAGRTRRTGFNWIAMTVGAGLNFGLNFWLIPAYGMLGAAYATLAAWIVIMAIRTVSAQKIYPVKYQWRRVVTALLAAGALTGTGAAFRQSVPLAFALTLAYPLVLAALGFYLPAERKRLRRLLPAH